MNIEEHIINKIMDYHGDIYKMLPEGEFPENKKRMRMNNWELTKKENTRCGGLSYWYSVDIKIDKNSLWRVFYIMLM